MCGESITGPLQQYLVLKLQAGGITTVEMAGLEKALLFPLRAAVVVLVLPFVVVEHVFDGLSLLASVGSLLQCDDKVKALRFITAHSTGALLKVKLPNSIAVRS